MQRMPIQSFDHSQANDLFIYLGFYYLSIYLAVTYSFSHIPAE